jgi:hypothetical protein
MFRDRLHQDEHHHAREMFETRMAALFEELPMLTGFFVDTELGVTELSIYTWPGWSAASALREDIAHFLLAMVQERPELAELLRGRTFTRSLQ